MSPGYIEKLLEPNTLSNLVLAIVGIVGIRFALKTLKATQDAAGATKTAAEATREQAQISRTALICQFRPRINVRAVRLIETVEEFSIHVQIVNKGETPAELTDGDLAAFFLFPYSPLDEPLAEATVNPFVLAPGEENTLKLDLKNEQRKFSMQKAASTGPDQRNLIVCRGKFRYRDDNGVIRKTTFDRLYDLNKDAFVVRPNTEDEYAD